MTHSFRKRLTKTLAPVALATAMMFAGPVVAFFHFAPSATAPERRAHNETVVFKQPGDHSQAIPGETGVSI
jgi:hypothetical protein